MTRRTLLVAVAATATSGAAALLLRLRTVRRPARASADARRRWPRWVGHT